MKKAVVLLSGGLDSAVTLFLARSKGWQAHCLIFDYGQRHRVEIKSARCIAQSINCEYEIIKINLPWKGSSLLDQKMKVLQRESVGVSKCQSVKVIPSTYVPGRNIIFLSFALSFAEAIKAEAIFIGANAVDFSGYPDCRPEFYDAFRRMISVGTKAGVEKKRIKIETPLINKTKAQIIKLGGHLGVPFELTWSCYQGANIPCGKCDSCYYRAKGFKEAKARDPLVSMNRLTHVHPRGGHGLMS
ncbi:MAG: 7-cyano-7-deazaguanine synthase QueC [Candidatus Omnitrophota bacterium]|nr:7-cyano-7-deazaguanine synthase QueC [Candidatus Omnitrophota bacterium]